MEKKFFDFDAYEQLIAGMAGAARAGDSDAALDLDAFVKARLSGLEPRSVFPGGVPPILRQMA